MDFSLTKEEKQELNRLTDLPSRQQTQEERLELYRLQNKRGYASIAQSNKILDPDKQLQVQLLTLVDSVTCECCKQLHKQVRSVGEPFLIKDGIKFYLPPFHEGCRCTVAAYRDIWQSIFEELEQDLKKGVS